MSPSRNWSYTGKYVYWLFVKHAHEVPMTEDIFDSLPILCMKYQRERCPTTGNLHWQGYIEMLQPVTYSYMRRKFPRVYFEPCMNRHAVQNYCRKTKTRVSEPVVWRRLPKPGSTSSGVEPALDISLTARVQGVRPLVGSGGHGPPANILSHLPDGDLSDFIIRTPSFLRHS